MMGAPSYSGTPPSGAKIRTSCPRDLRWRTVSLRVVTMPSILGTNVSENRAMRIVFNVGVYEVVTTLSRRAATGRARFFATKFCLQGGSAASFSDIAGRVKRAYFVAVDDSLGAGGGFHAHYHVCRLGFSIRLTRSRCPGFAVFGGKRTDRSYVEPRVPIGHARPPGAWRPDGGHRQGRR